MMESVIKPIAIVLSVATVVAAISYSDPNAYRCTSGSPTEDPVFSDTQPSAVALTHIFCGDIKGGKAQGFHSRHLAYQNTKVGEINQPQCAWATGKITQNYVEVKKDEDMDKDCTFDSEGIEVLSTFDNNWYPPRATLIKKGTNQGKLNKFFPDAMKPQQVVDIARKIFYVCMKGKMGQGPGEVCIKNYRIGSCLTDKLSIMIFTDGTNIVTAFPMDNDASCACDYESVKNNFDNYNLP